VVQVDVFWAYAIGAGCGAAAAAGEAAGEAAAGGGADPAAPARDLLDDRRLTATVLFLGCVFVPSGVWLLWRFTSWETMHAAAGPARVPGWLVAGFALTNLTQGILGYAVARGLWRRGHRYLAWLQMPLGYLAMFLLLAYGWDGTGYRRFLAPDDGAWRTGRLDAAGFLGSDVALTLLGMAAVLVPLLLWMQSSWWGARRWRTVALLLATIFGLALGTAVAATVLLTLLGPAAGVPATAALLVLALHPRGPAGALARRFPGVLATGASLVHGHRGAVDKRA
jgi:hypothetical protein